jgi:cytoplasmic iron level regulating protein YaaA (DUF328/UPF0246 family)
MIGFGKELYMVWGDRLEQQIDNATSKQNALLNVVMTKL